jgi:hypothetical protein|tara:strand:+ start:2231 stop:2410 length:180 start_codon:yes stop_codon:yes gene_type:complete
MGKMKEVFAQHQEEQDYYEKYYKELHYLAQDMKIQTKGLKELLIKTNKENGTRNKNRDA